MVLISQKTTEISGGVARPMTKSTLQDSKPKRANLALIHSNASIVKETTRRIPSIVHSGDIVSIVSGI